MCACDIGFVCARCAPRVAVDLGEWSEREIELWREQERLSAVDFELPFQGRP